MYRCRPWFNSKHGYPVKMCQCRNENFRRFFSIVSVTEGLAKSRKESFDLWFNYLHYNKSRSLFVKKPRAYRSNFIRATSFQHAPTPESLVGNDKSSQNRYKKFSHLKDGSDKLQRDGLPEEREKVGTRSFIFPENRLFDKYFASGVNKIQESLSADCMLDPGTSPMTIDDLELMRCTRTAYPLRQDAKTDEALYQELISYRNSPSSVEMENYRKKLPMFQVKDDILKLLSNNQVVVVTGSTGCGKSTQIVQYVLDDFILSRKGSLCNIICIVPRQVCATSLAARISKERQEPVSRSVGYQFRFTNALSRRKRGCINFVTTGIFLDMLKKQEMLNRFSHIFIDEVHERNIESDMILGALKQRLDEIPYTKIILMSGTMDPAVFSKYMGGAPHIEASGFLFPVKEYYLEDILAEIKFKFNNKKCEPVDTDFETRVLPYVRSIRQRYPSHVITELSKPVSEKLNCDLIADVIRHIVNNDREGCILVFLSTMSEIISMNKTLLSQPWYSSRKFVVLWMHSSFSSEQQEKIHSPTPEGTWKVIISTPILETSVTVAGVKYVIDAGRMLKEGYNVDVNVRELKPVWISQSNALQRRGRAGRVQKGVCIKLYTRGREKCFKDYPVPDFKCTSLEVPLMRAKCGVIGCDAREFFKTLLDPPQTPLVDASVKNLQEMDILDLEENLTPLGECVGKIPGFPQLSKLFLLGAIFRCFDPISSIASTAEGRDVFYQIDTKKTDLLRVKERYAGNDLSDHFIKSRIIKEWQLSQDKRAFVGDNMASKRVLELTRETKKRMAGILHKMGFLPDNGPCSPNNNIYSENNDLVKAVLCAGFYPNIAYERFFSDGSHLKPRGRTPVMFSRKSICNLGTENRSPFFAYFGQILKGAVFITDATMVNPLPVILFCKRLDILNKGTGFGYLVKIDEMLTFRIPRRTLEAIMEFRHCLREVLDHCYRDPGVLDKLHSTVMPDIVDLLSRQDLKFSMSTPQLL